MNSNHKLLDRLKACDAGYFDATRRFWTSQDFPNSEAVRGRIRTRLEATGLGDPSLRQAHEDLTEK